MRTHTIPSFGQLDWRLKMADWKSPAWNCPVTVSGHETENSVVLSQATWDVSSRKTFWRDEADDRLHVPERQGVDQLRQGIRDVLRRYDLIQSNKADVTGNAIETVAHVKVGQDGANGEFAVKLVQCLEETGHLVVSSFLTWPAEDGPDHRWAPSRRKTARGWRCTGRQCSTDSWSR